eukprot:scaffold61328_cov26-Tisochrysis_lutea.AAC.4
MYRSCVRGPGYSPSACIEAASCWATSEGRRRDGSASQASKLGAQVGSAAVPNSALAAAPEPSGAIPERSTGGGGASRALAT